MFFSLNVAANLNVKVKVEVVKCATFRRRKFFNLEKFIVPQGVTNATSFKRKNLRR